MIIGVTHDPDGRVVQRLSVSTKVSIGLPPNGDCNHPTKLDHFVFLRKKKTATRVEWEIDPDLTAHYGEQCRELHIILIDDDIENIFPSSYAWWTATERKCWGDGVSATRRTPEKPGGQPWQCGNGCPELAAGLCKPSGDLLFVLADFPRLGSVCRIHTSSYRSIRQIHSALQEIQTFTGGRLAGIANLTENARQVVRQYVAHAHSNRVDRPALPSPHSAPADISDRKIRGALQRALRERPVPTMKEIAWRLGIEPHRIYSHFQGFHKTLQQARLFHLEAAAKAALLESPPPTLRDFKKQRGFSRYTLQRRFPDLYRELALRSAQRRYRRREEMESVLRAACVEEPPPSGHALAARLGTNRRHIKKTFPEIWQLALQRHAAYQKQEALRRRAAFSETVRRIATEVLMAGKYPSRRRVLALMGDSELKGESLILPEVKGAVFAFRSQ